MRFTKKLAELFLSKPERSPLKQQEHAEGSSSSSSCVPLDWRKPGEQARKARASLQNAGSAGSEGLANGHAKWACPSQQSSAAQTPSSTRPSSKEHQRSLSGSDTLSERDEQEAQRGPQEGKARLDRTGKPPPCCPSPSPFKAAASGRWFTTASSEVAQQQHQEQEQREQQREEQVLLAAPELELASSAEEQEQAFSSDDESVIPDLKRVIGDMHLHVEHPVAHPSNARGCVFKAYWSNACVAVKLVPSTAPPDGLRYLGYCVDKQQLNHPNIVQMFESRTGRAATKFLQPCALTMSPFGSCSEALEELCPSSIMDAVLAASDAAAAGGNAPTAAAAAMLGSPHATPSPGKVNGREGQQHCQGKQDEQQQQQLSFSARTSSKRSSSGALDMFDSGDGFGVPSAAKSDRTSPMEWSQIMREAGVQAGDYVTLTLMDWCDCGTLHHAMAHAVFSLAPSRPASSSGSFEDSACSNLDTQHAPEEDPRSSSGGVLSPDEANQGTSSCCSAAQVSQDCMVGRSGSASGSASVRGMRTRYRGLLRTARDIAQGLEYLHARGIVHGALDPSNVLLKGSPADARGFVARLTNYNTSMEKARQAPSELTAPEVKEGQAGCMQPAADMWSFGALLRIMINRSLEAAHPGLDCGFSFGGHCEREGCLQGMPTTLIPQELTDLYNRCVSMNPAERPTAREAVAMLVTMEVRLRSKLGKQVWLHQQAHEQEWEEARVLARAAELQQQRRQEQQVHQMRAAQWEQLQQLDAQQQHLWHISQQQQQQQQQLQPQVPNLAHAHAQPMPQQHQQLAHAHTQPMEQQHQQLLYTDRSSVAAALSAVQQRLQAVHEQRVREELLAAHAADAQQQQQQQQQQQRWACQATLRPAPNASSTSECAVRASECGVRVPCEPLYQGMHSLVQQGAVLHPAVAPNSAPQVTHDCALGGVGQQLVCDSAQQTGCERAQQDGCDLMQQFSNPAFSAGTEQLGQQARCCAGGAGQQAKERRTSQDLQALLSNTCSATHTSATTNTAAHTANTAIIAGVGQQAKERRTSQDLQALLSGSCSATHMSATTNTAALTVNTATTATTQTASNTCEQQTLAAAAPPPPAAARPSSMPTICPNPPVNTSSHGLPHEHVAAAVYAQAPQAAVSPPPVSPPPQAYPDLGPSSPYVDAGSTAHVQHWVQQALALQQILANQASPQLHPQQPQQQAIAEQLLQLQEAATRFCQQQQQQQLQQQQQQQQLQATVSHVSTSHAPAVQLPHVLWHAHSQHSQHSHAAAKGLASSPPQQLHPDVQQARPFDFNQCQQQAKAQSFHLSHYQQPAQATMHAPEPCVLAPAAMEQHNQQHPYQQLFQQQHLQHHHTHHQQLTAGVLTQAALHRHLQAQQRHQQQLSQAAMQLHLRLRRAVRVSLHGGAHQEGCHSTACEQQQQGCVEQAVREADAAVAGSAALVAGAGCAQC